MIALLFALLSACSGAARPVPRTRQHGPAPVWAHALVPDQNDDAIRIDLHRATPHDHVALTLGGRVYASSGDDVPTAVAAPMLGLAFVRSARRAAVIGIGSGIELGVLLASGVEQVDLYEPNGGLLESAESLSDVSALTFAAHRPTHTSLRVLDHAESPVPPSYDLIVHAVGMTVISEPRRLFIVERLAALRDLLAPGGVVVLHAQLYEIHEATLRTLIRTFSDSFPHAAMMVAEDWSSDALLVGSREPIAISWPHTTALLARPSLAPFVARSGYTRTAAVALSALLASESEIHAYVRRGRVLTAAHPLGLDELPRRPPLPADTRDSWDRWETALETWHQDQGFDELLSSRFYDPEWAWGRPCTASRCTFLRDAPTGAAAGPLMLDLAFAAMEHGRLLWALELLDAARANAAPNDAIDRATAVVGLLGERTLAVADPVGAPLPLLDPAPSSAMAAALRIGQDGDWRRAAGKIEDALRLVTDRATTSALRLVCAAAYLRAHREADARRVLESITTEDAAFADAHPEVHYLLGRALVGLAENARAAAAMTRFVDTRPDPAPPPPP